MMQVHAAGRAASWVQSARDHVTGRPDAETIARYLPSEIYAKGKFQH